jgi:membrane-associated phospholipid phosphatase
VRTRRRPQWLRDAERVDLAVYAAVAVTPTPALDRGMSLLSRAADRSSIWLACSVALAVGRGEGGRAAARAGLASTAVASGAVNLVAKPLARRRRPDRDAHGVPLARLVPMPTSRSLPSGHAASAFAFATGVGHVLPRDAVALRALAALVAYSRVHTGVHFPADVVVGALLGTACAQTAARAVDRRPRRRRAR